MGKLRSSPEKLNDIKKVSLIEIAPIATLILSVLILLFVGVAKPHIRLDEFQKRIFTNTNHRFGILSQLVQ